MSLLSAAAAADSAERQGRLEALELYIEVLAACGDNPKRWASAEALVHANSQVALAFSLSELRVWLASGGMALGAPAHCFQCWTSGSERPCGGLLTCLLMIGTATFCFCIMLVGMHLHPHSFPPHELMI